MIINSKENPKIKKACKLAQNGKYRRETGLFVIEGLRLCRDAAINNFPVKEVYITEDFLFKYPDDFECIKKKAEEIIEVSAEVMKKLSDTQSPQGVFCVCPMLNERVVSKKGRLYLALDNVSDPGNMGTVARTAEAFGIDGLIIGSGCDPFSPKALRASMGALLRLPVTSCGNLTALLNSFSEKGIPLFASVVRNADKKIVEADFSKGGVMVIGNEAEGVSESVLQICDTAVTIPMCGRAESLNAAAAASVLMWEMTRKDILT